MTGYSIIFYQLTSFIWTVYYNNTDENDCGHENLMTNLTGTKMHIRTLFNRYDTDIF